MSKKNMTRRALFASVISLILCCAMLVGTTFAWFTDSVTSGVNKIQSGNLDVELSVKGAEGYAPIDTQNSLFSETLWEPGHVEMVNLQISNKGTLALKYQFRVFTVAETGSTNVAGEEYKLSDYIQYAIVPNALAENDRAAAVAAAEQNNPAKISAAELTLPGTMAAGAEPVEVALVVWMPETVGNEANYMTADNVKAPTITLGVELQATQVENESDSFGSDYDKEAPIVTYDFQVSSVEELEAAFAQGGNVLLTDDIEFSKMTSVEPGADVYLNLNGNTITVDEGTTSNTMIYVKDGAKLTIDGNGTIDLGAVSTMAIFAPYGELVIENGTFVRDTVAVVTNKTTGLFMGCKVTSSKVTINGGYFDAGYYDTNAAGIEAILAGDAELTETADDVAKRGNSKDANLLRVAVKDNVSALLNHSGYGSFKIYGGTFVGANPAWGDEGCMLPTNPNYLRPWSYYQGGLLDGQVFNENGIVLPDGYNITVANNADGIPVYTVTYSK